MDEAVHVGTHWDIVAFFIAQSIIIIGAIVTVHVKTQVSIEKVRGENNGNHTEAITKIDAVETNTKALKEDHGNLSTQVGGISRSLAELQGFVKGLGNVE